AAVSGIAVVFGDEPVDQFFIIAFSYRREPAEHFRPASPGSIRCTPESRLPYRRDRHIYPVGAGSCHVPAFVPPVEIQRYHRPLLPGSPFCGDTVLPCNGAVPVPAVFPAPFRVPVGPRLIPFPEGFPPDFIYLADRDSQTVLHFYIQVHEVKRRRTGLTQLTDQPFLRERTVHGCLCRDRP